MNFQSFIMEKKAHSLMKRSISCSGVTCISMAIEIKWYPLMKPSIFTNLSNGTKFYNCTY